MSFARQETFPLDEHCHLHRSIKEGLNEFQQFIFALSLTVADALGKLNIFFWFGMGFGIPLLALSFLSGAAQRWITRQFAMRAQLINFLSGLLLLGVGIYDLTINWELIKIYFG